MTNHQFVEMLHKAVGCNTLYVQGGIGSPAGYANNRTRYKQAPAYNTSIIRRKMIDTCPDDTFFFDCVCLGKAILWGWNADTNAVYGGAKYQHNGVPDFWHGDLKKHCTEYKPLSNKIEIGEWLLMPNHIGYYIGDGMVIECTPNWTNNVQYTKLQDRGWTHQGKIKYLEYVSSLDPLSNNVIICPHCKQSFPQEE